MRRWIALTATVLIAPALATTNPAAALTAPVDPVTTLKQQFRPGHGVRVGETIRLLFDKGEPTATRRVGRLQFGSSGLIAGDTTRRIVDLTTGKASTVGLPQRTISVDGRLYVSGGIYGSIFTLPKGKKWVRPTKKTQNIGVAFGDQTLNVFEPNTLKTLLRDSAGSPSGSFVQYQGGITYAELYKISKSFRAMNSSKPTGDFAGIRIDWQLWIDAKGLVNRLVTKIEYPESRSLTLTSDTRYTDWGSRVVVTVPPAGQVIDQKDIR